MEDPDRGSGPGRPTAKSALVADDPALTTTEAGSEAADAALAWPAPGLRPRHNLPHPTTRFVGRTAELQQLDGWHERTRLLTLTGMGGVGKTRLSLELGRSAVDRFAEGVWLVELAALEQSSLVPRAIAAVLDVRESPDRPTATVLAEAIGSRALLLLLDNCEHLIESCAALADTLLRACPQLVILATSREPLGIDGEVVWRAPGLQLPSGSTVAEAAGAEALDLFLERAQARRPDLRLTRDNVAALVQICRQLDGLPLALELAAARVDVLDPREIAARLDERFELLTGGSRVALPRHRTLRALVDWSYTLLPPGDQQVFRRLAVFSGGWTLEAATAVALNSHVAALDAPGRTLDVLARLTARSLVQAEPIQGQTRYRLLETIRAYAQGLLSACGEVEQVRQRHAEHYLRILEPFEAGDQHGDIRQQLDGLEREHDNLRAALGWLRDSGQAEAGLRLSSALWWFWSVRGYLGEGRSWLQRFLDAVPASEPVSARSQALYGAGVLARLQGDLEAAHAAQAQALELARIQGDLGRMAHALTELADIADSRGAFDEARRLLDEGIRLWRRLPSTRNLAGALARLARIALRQGDVAAVPSLLDESGRLATLVDSADIVAACAFYRGELLVATGAATPALQAYQACLSRFRELGYQRWIARTLEALAALDAAHAPERAMRLAGAGARLRVISGQPLSPSERARLEARLLPARTALGDELAEIWYADPLYSLDAAIHEALTTPPVRRERALGETSQEQLSAPAGDGVGGPLGLLTRREREVLALLARGHSNPQISSELVVSRRTVEAHVTAILSKLGLETRTQVAVWAVEHGLRGQ